MVQSTISFQQSIIVITDVAHHFNPRNANVSFTLERAEGHESVLNVVVVTNREIIKLIGQISLNIPLQPKDLEFSKNIFQSTIDMCKLGRGVRANFLTKVIMENFEQSANFKMECPMKAQTFLLQNFTLADSFIPGYMITEDYKFVITAKMQGKFAKAKSLEYLYTLKTFGEIRKE